PFLLLLCLLVFIFIIYSSFIPFIFLSFCFDDTATIEIYTLSLHDALPIFGFRHQNNELFAAVTNNKIDIAQVFTQRTSDQLQHRSEEHTSELQSRENLVCRLLLEKKKINK